MTRPIIVWFRSDLRITDHEPLHRAAVTGAPVLPVYCFDPRQFGETSFGFPRTGPARSRFLLEALTDLRASLRAVGSDLIVREGEPEAVIPALARMSNAAGVYFHQEVGTEELAVERALRRELAATETVLRGFWGHTLVHRDDLPFQVDDVPEVFTAFRNAVERRWRVRETFPAPRKLAAPTLPPGELPTEADLDLPERSTTSPTGMTFTGGETAGMARIEAYFWKADALRAYKETRNGMLGADYSSKFSPWLALGCLSPRTVYEEVKRYEERRVKNDSTYWLIFELLWRDYFRFILLKHGATLFLQAGLRGVKLPWKTDDAAFAAWRDGRTGFPLVDANMRELAATGFMSNRGRQNVASFLTKNLGIDWRRGAEWFESCLIDYDVASNYGNWNYAAGVGNDARGFRFFNIYKQAEDYDPQGAYVRHWLPELAGIPGGRIHQPHRLTPEEQRRCGVSIGEVYPLPIVDLFASAKANEQAYNRVFRRFEADHSPRRIR